MRIFSIKMPVVALGQTIIRAIRIGITLGRVTAARSLPRKRHPDVWQGNLPFYSRLTRTPPGEISRPTYL